jgi:HK97 family phage major capsid protein
MNIEAKERQLAAQAKSIEAKIDNATTAKQLREISLEVEQWEHERNKLQAIKGNKNYSALRDSGGDLGREPTVYGGKAISEHFDQHGNPITTTMRDLNPLVFDDNCLNLIEKSMKMGQPFNTKIVSGDISTKSFNTVESLLPAQLMPGVVERIHEPRIADLLPTVASSTLNYEYIKDSTSSNAVTSFTAEGATAPDVTLTFTESTLAAAPVKATFGLSYETASDRPTLLGYIQGEVFKQFSDFENTSLLTGTSDITGLNETSGISTVAVPGTLPTGANTFDYVISLIDVMRTSASLANPNIGIVSPSTWHAMVAQNKDSLGRWLTTPNPAEDILSRLWGIRLVLSTQQTAGTMTLIDTEKFGFIVLREGIRLFQGYNDLDFSQFINRFGMIERLNLAVVRPTAVGTLTGLPSSFAV